MKNLFLFIVIFSSIIIFSCTTQDDSFLDSEAINSSVSISQEEYSTAHSISPIQILNPSNRLSPFARGLRDGARDGQNDRTAFVNALGAPASSLQTRFFAVDSLLGTRTVSGFNDSSLQDNETVIRTVTFTQDASQLAIQFFNSSDTQFRLSFFASQRAANASPGSEYWRGAHAGYEVGIFFGAGAGL